MRSMLLAILILATAQSFARDKDRGFKRGNGISRGNERSERPGRVTAGQVSHEGNGCPQGSMSIAFAPDMLSFSLLFDQFVAQVSPDQKAKSDVMTCNALIPVQLPPNMQMEISRVDLRGFSALPAGSRGELHSIFNFRGRGGDGDRINLRYQFQGPNMDNYLITTDAMNASGQSEVSERSPCGGQTVLRVGTQIKIMSPTREQATLTLDSVDASSHAIYYVNWRSCRG